MRCATAADVRFTSPVGPPLGRGEERDLKGLEACDRRKPLRSLRSDQGQNRGRHLSVDQPIDRRRRPFAELDFARPRRHDRGPDTAVGRGVPVVDRNRLAGEVGYRFDVRSNHQNGNQTVGVIGRRGCGVATRLWLRTIGTVFAARFGVRRRRHSNGRRSLREHPGGRRVCLDHSGVGARSAGRGMRLRAVGRRRVGSCGCAARELKPRLRWDGRERDARRRSLGLRRGPGRLRRFVGEARSMADASGRRRFGRPRACGLAMRRRGTDPG